MKQRSITFLLLALSGLAGILFYQYQHPAPQPVSAEVVMMQTFHYPTLFVKQLKNDRHAGEKIFKQFCTSCHGEVPIIDVKAPRIGDQSAWKLRRKLGLPTLLEVTITGVGAMPARGGCFECSDEQLRETIKYMLRDNQ